MEEQNGAISESVFRSTLQMRLTPVAVDLGVDLDIGECLARMVSKEVAIELEYFSDYGGWQLTILVERVSLPSWQIWKIRKVPFGIAIETLSQGLSGHWPRYLNSTIDLEAELLRVGNLLRRFAPRILACEVDWVAAEARLRSSIARVKKIFKWGGDRRLYMTLDAADKAFGCEYFHRAKELYESLENQLGPADQRRLAFLRQQPESGLDDARRD